MTEYIKDFITGDPIALIGAEENRQAVMRKLVSFKGYLKEDIRKDVPIEVMIGSDAYHSKVDIVVALKKKAVMIVKCAAGSLGSREREALAAARLLEPNPIPLTIVSDGDALVVLDTQDGKLIGRGWESVPTRDEALERLSTKVLAVLSPQRKQKEGLIFRSYDSMIVNR